MTTIMIRHKVNDVDAWKRGYDAADAIRREHNVVRESAHQDVSASDTVMAVHQFETLEDARSFLEAIAPAMKEAGVVGQPEVWIGHDL